MDKCLSLFLSQYHPSEFGIFIVAIWAHVPANKTAHGFSNSFALNLKELGLVRSIISC